jgi:hypothetical protein
MHFYLHKDLTVVSLHIKGGKFQLDHPICWRGNGDLLATSTGYSFLMRRFVNVCSEDHRPRFLKFAVDRKMLGRE